jgi:hypothetical protein
MTVVKRKIDIAVFPPAFFVAASLKVGHKSIDFALPE